MCLLLLDVVVYTSMKDNVLFICFISSSFFFFSSSFFVSSDVLLSLVIHTEVQENLHAPEAIVEITEAHLIKTCTHKDFFYIHSFQSLYKVMAL